jgi:hypothetical protein
MDDRIPQDPRLEILPNHAGPHYNGICQLLQNTGLTLEQAVQSLNDLWTQSCEERIQAWDQQVLNDNVAAEEAQCLRQEEEQLLLQQEQQNLENERIEAEKKKPKMNDFQETTMVGNYIAPCPSQYALHRLKNFEYLELWYLTQEGCADAAQHQHMQNDDTFGLTKVDNVVALRQVSALRASKNVVPDVSLSFRQMSIAKTALIQQMTKFQWPNKAITALAEFFTNLEVHPYHQREFGEQALLTYQVWVWQNWHDTLKQNSAFNIALLNEDLLQSIYKEVVTKAQIQSLIEVSILFWFLSHAVHSHSPSPSFFFLFHRFTLSLLPLLCYSLKMLPLGTFQLTAYTFAKPSPMGAMLLGSSLKCVRYRYAIPSFPC